MYAAYNISEFWLYDGDDFAIYVLENETYAAQPNSRHLSVLTAAKLGEMLNAGRERSEKEILREFETWLIAQN